MLFHESFHVFHESFHVFHEQMLTPMGGVPLEFLRTRVFGNFFLKV